ncbi:helix-turn-helix transcriptional regulator [Saccharothrix sp. ST-888]|uniref:helix-turn-helix transcriptional regulator n=1 Tax=Saccharothrix sp. ST-888 TaxID=1427391 RepID=UPI0009E5AFB3|nr:helix-turn-helix domain-containing protein [Saccharothrix sp. ST-888]
MESSDPGVHKALAVPARRALLAALTDAAEPLDNRRLSELVGQHITTVRHHLTALVEAGLVEVRQEEPTGGRGRPRLLYAAAPERAQLAAYRTLVEVLATGFGDSRAERARRAGEAGRSWGATEAGTDGSLTEQVLAAADVWGFEPELRAGGGVGGGEVLLHGCPFQHNAERHPEVVCSVHQGLLNAMAERAGQPGALRLHPFVGPRVCSISITRHRD